MKYLLRKHSFSIAFLSLFLAYVFTTGGGNDGIERMNGFTMGTRYQFQLVDLPAEQDRQEVAESINGLLARLDREIFSTYAAESELSRFNRTAPGTEFAVSREMMEVVQLALEISELTGGAFDVTVGPLVNLWGFGSDRASFDTVPEAERIEALLEEVNYRFLRLNAEQGTLSKRADVHIDLSGIAKGYAVDEVALYFESLGVHDYFLEIGGELRIKGFKPGNESWVPAIETPGDAVSEVYRVLHMGGESIAVAGSGDYRNYFEQDGVRYSHEIDPRTGYPARHSLAAVYVISDSAARADALSTAFMVMGREEGMALAQQRGIAVYFISRDGEGGFSDDVTRPFRDYLTERG
ncbi:MAG: FAD:protein FMN transferase [Pseudohongiellaceae bacterium]